MQRKFPIDSRAGWVESMHASDINVCIPIEDISVGPFVYSPIKCSRHISTPSLGKSKLMDEILAVSTRSGSRNQKIRESCENLRQDFATIHHDHDKRVGIDPNRRFCRTPGPYLINESILSHMSTDGKILTHSVNFGPKSIPFGERNDFKVALPEYDPQYESDIIRSSSRLVTIPKTTRFRHYDIQQKSRTESELENERKLNENSDQIVNSSRPNSSSQKVQANTGTSNGVSIVKINVKKKQEMKFIVPSSYSTIKAKEISLTPKIINDTIRSNMFNKLYSIPRNYQSQKVDSSIAERIRPYT